MVILDVREREEFEGEHIPGSISCPLSQFDYLAPGILKNINDSDVLLMCRSGKRAELALKEIAKLNQVPSAKFTVFHGGILQWKAQGREIKGEKAIFPIMRQVQIVASTIIFFAFLSAYFVHPALVYFALMVGFGLALSGYTGYCPMVHLLQKMPWNKKAKSE